jgi:hypothetical protein
MTEAEWLVETKSGSAIMHLGSKVSDRKLRLFGVACCWLCKNLHTEPESRKRLELIELYADGASTDAELQATADDAWELATGYTSVGIGSPWVGSKEWNQQMEKGRALEAIGWLATLPTPQLPVLTLIVNVVFRLEDSLSFEYQLRPLLHEIVGNPFRPGAFSPEWRTETALALARSMYELRDFSVMPILADALQDAGCENEDLLNHCRSYGPHVRGCWVVDLVLGRA